ncbi:MAG: GTPase ObgE [Candidatus Omnitrophota bacterium]|jgi:GTP-binding protein
MTHKEGASFIDEARIFVKAGDGGDGCSSRFRTIINRIGSPDGGPGGDGADIVFSADQNIHTLLDFQFRQHFKASCGTNGSSNHKKGHRGEDLIIRVPPGTLIRDANTGLILRDLAKVGDSVIIAKGGHGGRGNSRGRESTPGSKGDELTLLLELKLIADVGIIGYPNAGKSTLISKISGARPKIASYPFTTKSPNLGVIKLDDDLRVLVADIPGLIEGAHRGRGLGHKFLRHVERTKVLIHLVDIAATDARSPCSDYLKLNEELKLYSKELAEKLQIIALNKIDSPEAKAHIKEFKKRFPRKKYYEISAITGKGVDKLMKAVCKKLKSVKDEKI